MTRWVFGGVGVLLLMGMCSALLGPTKDSTITASSGTPAASPKVALSDQPAAPSTAAVASVPSSEAPKEVGTVSQRNALRSAQSYIGLKGFSKLGLIRQAVRAGQSYLDMKGFSRAGPIQQLSSAYGEQFTKAQATYAADKLGLT